MGKRRWNPDMAKSLFIKDVMRRAAEREAAEKSPEQIAQEKRQREHFIRRVLYPRLTAAEQRRILDEARRRQGR